MDKKNHSMQMKKMSLKKELVIGIGVGIILAAIFIAFQVDRQTANAGQSMTIPEIAQDTSLPQTPLTVESNPDDTIALMLNSHTQWQTIEASAITTFNDTTWVTNIQIDYEKPASAPVVVNQENYENTWVYLGTISGNSSSYVSMNNGCGGGLACDWTRQV